MENDRRRSPRRWSRGTLLLFEIPTFSGDYCWFGRLVDISGDGLAMKLPPERLEPRVGDPIFLSMLFQDRVHFDRVPAVFVRQQGEVGAVEFKAWPKDDRERLLALLSELGERRTDAPPPRLW